MKLHDKHNDLPFLPQNSIPVGLKIGNYWLLWEEEELHCSQQEPPAGHQNRVDS